MHYKIFTILTLTIFFTSSCSNKKTSYYKVDITNDEIIEMELQKKLLIHEMAISAIKLHKITWPILKKNKYKCIKNTTKSYGILYADANDIPEEDRKIYKNLYNKNISEKYFKNYKVNHFPIILSVAENSPGFFAGLKENDLVLEVNKSNTNNFRKKLANNMINQAILNIKILRENKIIEKRLNGINICVYNIQPIPSGSPNAFADGNKVFITLAAIKLARTNDELAFLIGHEIAHNILHYKSFNANEAESISINYLDKPKIREFKNLFVASNENREIEADIEGIKLAFQAGYSLENVNEYWRRLSIFNPELISKSINIYKSNAYRAALISKTLKSLKEKKNEKKN